MPLDPVSSRRCRFALILLAFLLTRIATWALHAPEIQGGDQLEYLRVAQSLLDHGPGGFFDPGYVVQKGDYYPWFRNDRSLPDGEYNTIFWDPLYPLFLAGIFSVTGVSYDAARLAQLLLSLATLLIGIDAVRRMFPREPRLPELFGWMLVAYLPLAGFVTRLLAETLAAFLITAGLWWIVRLPRARPAAFLAFGALVGLLALVQSYWLQLLPAVLVLCWWALSLRGGSSLRPSARAVRLALVVAGAALVIAPIFVRNYHISGGSLLISTKGSWNFWKDNNHFAIVNHAWREEGLRVHSWLRAYFEVGAAGRVPKSLRHVYYDPSETNVRPPCDTTLDRMAACERNAAIVFLLEDPLRFARRALEKNANLWSPNNYVFSRAPPGRFAWHQNYRIELPTPVRYLLQLWVILVYLLVMLAGFVGLVVRADSLEHRVGRAFVVFLLLGLTLVVVPWGHGVTRFRLPYMVPLMMFSALGLVRGREVLTRSSLLDPGNRSRVVVLASLTLMLAAVSVARLPVLLAP